MATWATGTCARVARTGYKGCFTASTGSGFEILGLVVLDLPLGSREVRVAFGDSGLQVFGLGFRVNLGCAVFGFIRVPGLVKGISPN